MRVKFSYLLITFLLQKNTKPHKELEGKSLKDKKPTIQHQFNKS